MNFVSKVIRHPEFISGAVFYNEFFDSESRILNQSDVDCFAVFTARNDAFFYRFRNEASRKLLEFGMTSLEKLSC